jgi:hypothetical protein
MRGSAEFGYILLMNELFPSPAAGRFGRNTLEMDF